MWDGGHGGALVPVFQHQSTLLYTVHMLSLCYSTSLNFKHLLCYVHGIDLFVSECSLKIFKTFYLWLLGAGGGVLSAGEI